MENLSGYEQSSLGMMDKREQNTSHSSSSDWQQAKAELSQSSADIDKRTGKAGQSDSSSHRLSESLHRLPASIETSRSQTDSERHSSRLVQRDSDVKVEVRDHEPGEIYDDKDALSSHRFSSHYSGDRDSERGDYKSRRDGSSAYDSASDRRGGSRDARDSNIKQQQQSTQQQQQQRSKDRNVSKSPERRSQSKERRMDDVAGGKAKGSPIKGQTSPRSHGSRSQTPERGGLFDEEGAEPGNIRHVFLRNKSN